MRLRMKIKVSHSNSCSLQFTLSTPGSWLPTRYQGTNFLHGLSHKYSLFYRRNIELLYDLGTKGCKCCFAKSNLLLPSSLPFMIFPGNLLLLWEEIKLEAVTVVKKGRLVLPDVKSPRNGNKTKQITTAKIKVIREVKGTTNIKEMIIEKMFKRES